MDEKEEKVVRAAKEVFLKYGYVKVTMSDIAKAAGMSRPSLYLVFPGKEEIFSAVILELAAELSQEVKHRIAGISDPAEKLRQVFEVWAVELHDMLNQSSESKELYESKFSFAREGMLRSREMFEADIARVLSLFSPQQLGDLRPEQLAHIFSSAVTGFKQNSASAGEMRSKISLLLKACLKA